MYTGTSNRDGRIPITSIRVGPIGEQELAGHSLQLLLKSKGYENATELVQASSYQLR
jgi:hypothetical protein